MFLFIVGFLMLFSFVVIAMLVSETEYSENITVLELVCAVREKTRLLVNYQEKCLLPLSSR